MTLNRNLDLWWYPESLSLCSGTGRVIRMEDEPVVLTNETVREI